MAKKKQVKIAPSILAGDFGKLADEAKRIEESGADAIHFDVMDGHFVPNLTLGPKALAAINRTTDMFLDVHLMMYSPFDYVQRFVEAGADNITFHFEATEDVEDTINFIKKCNISAGLAFCPETSESMVPQFLPLCDKVLLMTVHPGFGGQGFIKEVLEKIRLTKEICDKQNLDVDIQVDGGITDKTAKLCLEAGANDIVAGTYCFTAPEGMKAAVKSLRGDYGNQ
jgi:ribulose-phosphate 3-epimerase